ELDDARIFVRSEARADVLLQYRLERVAGREAWLEDDDRFHHLGADGIGLAHHRRQRDGGVAGETGFDLPRPDAVPAARDQIVVAPDEAEVPGFGAHPEIAADQPVAQELGAGC